MSEICMNCGRAIGALEKACVFNGKVLCFDCDGILRRQAGTSTKATDDRNYVEETEQPTEDSCNSSALTRTGDVIDVPDGHVVCPYCGYIGQPLMVRKPRATDGLFLFGDILFMLFLLPFLWFFSALTNKYIPCCPICKNYL